MNNKCLQIYNIFITSHLSKPLPPYTHTEFVLYQNKNITLSVTNDDANIPPEAIRPPMNVVNLIPILSVKIPATGDRKNVVPIVSDPTSAKQTYTHLLIKQSIIKLPFINL